MSSLYKQEENNYRRPNKEHNPSSFQQRKEVAKPDLQKQSTQNRTMQEIACNLQVFKAGVSTLQRIRRLHGMLAGRPI